MRIGVKAVLLSAALAIFCGQASAQDRLLFPSLSPAGGDNSVLLNEWADRVNQASNGALEIEIRDGTSIANYGNILERLTGGVVQIGWALLSQIAGRFPNGDVVSLPGLRGSAGAETTSVAAWRLYDTGLLDSEFEGLKVLQYAVQSPASVHFAKKPDRERFDDLSGLRIAVQSGLVRDIVLKLGGTPVSMENSAWYEGLRRGTVDAVISAWAAFAPFSLHEVTEFHLEVPLNSTTHVYFMQQSVYDGLSDESKAALEANIGEEFSRMMGAHFERQTDIQRERAVARGAEIYRPAGDELQTWLDAIEPVVVNWVSEGEGRGELVDTFREIIAELN